MDNKLQNWIELICVKLFYKSYFNFEYTLQGYSFSKIATSSSQNKRDDFLSDIPENKRESCWM